MEEDKKILEKKIKIFNNFYQECKEKNCVNEIVLKEKLFDVLSWFEICFKNAKISDTQQVKKRSALMYANNMKKHSKSLFKYTKDIKGTYPSNELFPSNETYPSSFSIYWSRLPLDNKNFRNKFRNYNNILKGKDVYDTINDIYTIIK